MFCITGCGVPNLLYPKIEQTGSQQNDDSHSAPELSIESKRAGNMGELSKSDILAYCTATASIRLSSKNSTTTSNTANIYSIQSVKTLCGAGHNDYLNFSSLTKNQDGTVNLAVKFGRTLHANRECPISLKISAKDSAGRVSYSCFQMQPFVNLWVDGLPYTNPGWSTILEGPNATCSFFVEANTTSDGPMWIKKTDEVADCD